MQGVTFAPPSNAAIPAKPPPDGSAQTVFELKLDRQPNKASTEQGETEVNEQSPQAPDAPSNKMKSQDDVQSALAQVIPLFAAATVSLIVPQQPAPTQTTAPDAASQRATTQGAAQNAVVEIPLSESSDQVGTFELNAAPPESGEPTQHAVQLKPEDTLQPAVAADKSAEGTKPQPINKPTAAHNGDQITVGIAKSASRPVVPDASKAVEAAAPIVHTKTHDQASALSHSSIAHVEKPKDDEDVPTIRLTALTNLPKQPERTQEVGFNAPPHLDVDTRMEVAREVARHIASLHASTENRSLTIRVDPPELGSIELTVHSRGNDIEAQVVTQHDWLRHAIESSSSHLREVMASRGMNLAGLSVGLQGQQMQRQFTHTPSRRHAISAAPAPAPPADAAYSRIGAGRWDILA